MLGATASASAILKNVTAANRDAEHKPEMRSRNLEPRTKSKVPAKPQVLLEARGAANNVREREGLSGEPPISIRHCS